MEDSVTESEIKREIERKPGDREEEVSSKRDHEEEIMEGGFISQFISNLVSPSSLKSREICEEEKVEETQSGEGIIDKISNYFHQQNEDGEKEKEIDEMNVEEEGEEKKKMKGMEELDDSDSGGGGGGGGVVNNLISNFFHQNEGEERGVKRGRRSEEVGGDLKMEEEEDEKDFRKRDLELDNGGGGSGGGGGRINNLISNFFHQGEGEGEGEGEEGGLGLGEKGTNSDQELMNGKGDVRKEQESKMKVEGANGGIINNLVSNLTASLPEDTVPASDEASILIHSIIHD